jgi:hypothetical protein
MIIPCIRRRSRLPLPVAIEIFTTGSSSMAIAPMAGVFAAALGLYPQLNIMDASVLPVGRRDAI